MAIRRLFSAPIMRLIFRFRSYIIVCVTALFFLVTGGVIFFWYEKHIEHERIESEFDDYNVVYDRYSDSLKSMKIGMGLILLGQVSRGRSQLLMHEARAEAWIKQLVRFQDPEVKELVKVDKQLRGLYRDFLLATKDLKEGSEEAPPMSHRIDIKAKERAIYALNDVIDLKEDWILGKIIERIESNRIEQARSEQATKATLIYLAIAAVVVTGLLLTIADETKLRMASEAAFGQEKARAEQFERLALEEAVARAEASERASRAKSEFLANISHELRTPMHGILSYARFGQTKLGKVTAAEVMGYFDEIQASGTRLMSLLNDLLDLAELESGKVAYVMAEGQVINVVRSLVHEMKISAMEKGIGLEINSTAKESTALFDQGKLQQALRNILSNAIRFSFPGTSVRIVVTADEEKVRCEVKNTGVGIPEEELTLIFEKFIQSSNTKSGAGGRGLGLAICRAIVEQHGGRVWASNSGPDTVFCLELNRHKSGQEVSQAS